MTEEQQPILGTFAARGFEVQTLILVNSLRKFGGKMADIPVWIAAPHGHSLESEVVDTLETLGVRFIPFEISKKLRRFPFGAKAVAAAAIESEARKIGLTLAWHDRTGLIRNTPEAFQLPQGTALGFRPTDIINIGVPANAPLTPFWRDICTQFDVPKDALTEITTVIDEIPIHLYVNAGLLVVRPENGLLSRWAENLTESFMLPKFVAHYRKNQQFAVFMHQAALTAAVVQTTPPEERYILPENYLFSVDNFFDYPEEKRPASLDAIITGRFHDFFNNANWKSLIIASDALLDWFRAQLTAGPYWPERSQ